MLQPYFNPRFTRNLDEIVREVVAAQFESVRQLPAFDLAKQLAEPVTLAVNGHFMGIAASDNQAILAAVGGNVYEADHDKVADFFQLFFKRNEDRRSYKGMAGALLALVDEGKLKQEGAVHLMKLLWTAGSGTTSMLLGQLAWLLLTRPALTGRLSDAPELIPKFVEECLRLYPPFAFLSRLAIRDTTLGGKSIPAGSKILVSLLAVNRDPGAFPEPDEKLLDRPARRHFAFGTGIHHCAGSNIARMAAHRFVAALLPLVGRLEFVPFAPAGFTSSQGLNGITSLPPRWKKEL
jgi:cytochrome P450